MVWAETTRNVVLPLERRGSFSLTQSHPAVTVARMTAGERYSHIAFLLAFGATPFGCNGKGSTGDDTDGSTGTDSATTGTAGTTSTTGTAGTTSTTGTAGTTSTTGTAGTTSTTGTAGTTSTTGTTGGETTGTTDGATSVCEEYAAKYLECYPDPGYTEQDFIDYCEDYLAYGAKDGQDCVDAMEAYYSCISSLDCNELETGCKAESVAIDTNCPSLGGSTSTSGGGDPTGP